MFELNEKLKQDTVVLGQLDLSLLLLMNDETYPWLILVPKRSSVTEIYHLSAQEQTTLLSEMTLVSEKLADAFAADSMNVAALGNVVPQLHVHIVVRKKTDKTWPAPVWGLSEPVPYGANDLDEMVKKIHMLLSDKLQSPDQDTPPTELY